MKKLLKNIFPGLLLFWILYLVEWNFITIEIPFKESHTSLFYLHYFFTFAIYTFFGLILGIISGGILAKKRVRYYSIIDPNREPYYTYFAKNFFSSLLILLIVLLREIINQPALFGETYLNENFVLYEIFNFIALNFSPLYFTSFLAIVISIFFYKTIMTYTFKDGLLKLYSYLISCVFLIFLLFNYGFLNAAKENTRKNLVLIGVEDFNKKYLNKRYNSELPAIFSLRTNSYNFENCYSISTKMLPAVMATASSNHPENGGLKYDRSLTVKNRLKYPYYLSLLQNIGYNIMTTGDGAFYNLRENLAVNKIIIPKRDSVTALKTAIMRNHPLLFLINNNFLTLKILPEILSLPQYQEKGFYLDKIDDLIKNKNQNFAALYLLSKSIKDLPFPFAGMAKTDGELAYAKFIDQGVGIILEKLKRENRYQNTVIVFFGLPGKDGQMKAANMKIPLLISLPEYKKERKIKNNYTNLDILPSTYQLVTGDSLLQKTDGFSLFDPFVRQDIFITDNLNNTLKKIDPAIADSFLTKKENIEIICSEKETIISLLANRTFIRGNYKLDILPGNKEVDYQLYNLKNDPYEKVNIIEENKRTAQKMILKYEKIFRKKNGYNFINGYSIK